MAEEVPEWVEDMDVRKIITGTITAGGLFIFLVVFGAICLVRRLKKMHRFSRAKVNIEPPRGTLGKHD